MKKGDTTESNVIASVANSTDLVFEFTEAQVIPEGESETFTVVGTVGSVADNASVAMKLAVDGTARIELGRGICHRSR